VLFYGYVQAYAQSDASDVFVDTYRIFPEKEVYIAG
jgi:hypothetical protein